MAADIITILTCFGPTLQFVVVNVIFTLRSHLFITDAKSLRYRQCGICPQFSLYVTLIINYLFSTVATLPDVNSPASTIVAAFPPCTFGTSPFHLSIFCFSISSGVSDSAIFLFASASASALILVASALPSAVIFACSASIAAFSLSCSAAMRATSLSLSACTFAVLASIFASSSSCYAFTFF